MNYKFSTHRDHVSVGPANGIGPAQGQRKPLIKPKGRGFNSHPGQSFRVKSVQL